jgi:very-short-patch-repair endonuclease
VTGEFKPRNTARAKTLRNQATPTERLLWTALSNRKVDGYKFSRQIPVGPYFADFLCREARLVVELDGFSHDLNQDYDQRRDAFMKAQGYQLLRFNNADVMNNLEGVVETIALMLTETGPPPAPPASGRGVEMTRISCSK